MIFMFNRTPIFTPQSVHILIKSFWVRCGSKNKHQEDKHSM